MLSLQAQHPSSASGKVLHFHVVVFPLKPSTTAGASEEQCFSFPHIPIHYTRVYSSVRVHCKKLELFCEIFISSFYPYHPLYGIYPTLSPLSHPCHSLAWESACNKAIPSPAGHLPEMGPTDQNPALTSILSLNWHPAFIQTVPNPQGAPSGIASSPSCSLGPVSLSQGHRTYGRCIP